MVISTGMAIIKTTYDPFVGEKETQDPFGGIEFTNSKVTIGKNVFYSKGYNLCTSWYIDATAGSDDADGSTPSTALKTLTELSRRLQGETILQSTVIHLLSSQYPITDLLQLELKVGGDGTVILIDGSGAVSSSAKTLTSITNLNAAGNVIPSFVVSGEAFASKLGALYKDSAGTSCWIGGAGGTSSTALTSIPYKVDFANYVYTQTNMISTAAEVTLPKLYVGNIKVQSDNNTPGGCSILFRDINFANTYYNSFSLVAENDSQVYFERCKFEGMFYGIENAPSIAYFGCYFSSFYLFQTSASQMYGCMSRNNEIFQGCYCEFADHVFVGGTGGSRNNEALRIRPGGTAKVGNAGYIKATQYGIWIEPGGSLMHDGTVFGGVTGVAIRVDANAGMTVVSKPVLSGTTGDFLLAGANTYRSWDEAGGVWSAATSCTFTNFGSAATANAHNVAKGAKLVRK